MDDKHPATIKKLLLADTSINKVPVLASISGTKKAITKGLSSTTKKDKPPPKEKPIPCFIHLAKLKEFPEIMITQVRFKAFDDIPICLAWCEEHCVSYEIRSHKNESTLIKFPTTIKIKTNETK